ncbi:MAG: hypothetical protein J7J54_03215 [Candidatus Omnitrophica bacterium]|nr:hypothetical protein [Candidatus Omnitrophota bacterium]
MRKNKITILILGIVGILIFGSQIALAQDNPSVFVSPANLTKNVGDSFDLAVKINPGGQKVCAVEGQLALSKLTVQKVSVADGIISQTSPSFSNNFYFLLGIPGCTTQEKTLFTIRVKANAIGKAGVGFRNVDIIGEGISVSSAFVGGNYEIIIPETPVKVEKEQKPSVISPCVCEKWSSWQNKGCGEGGCLETQRLQVRNRNCNPSGCDIEEQTQCVNDPICIASAKTSKPAKKIEESKYGKSLMAGIGSIVTLGTGQVWVGILLLLVIISAFLFLFITYRKRKTTGNRE